MHLSLIASLLVAVATTTVTAKPHHRTPRVQTRNGTYEGVHSREWDQDYFLGVPYAQPPVGDLRFRNPRSLNKSWHGTHEALEYSDTCVGYGVSQIGYVVNEDCLYLNVVRPSGYDHKKLPVAVWIHGGGYYQGGGVDRRYNLSFIVDQSVKIGHPVIGVSINYRLSAWGFLSAQELFDSGESNFGVRDQRLSLHWLRENIAEFGGNPEKVTIWGQSAGAGSVGIQMLAYNGRDDKLFRSAIMESGAPVALSNEQTTEDDAYELLLEKTGCNHESDGLQCLRGLPFGQLNAALNTTALATLWGPRIDGDFIQRNSTQQLDDGHFVKVPAIIGANTDEGTSFSPQGINTTAQFRAAILRSDPLMNSSFADKILRAYGEHLSEPILPNLADDWVPSAKLGALYRSVATYYGDRAMLAPRRRTCETWAKNHLTAYCYRFNAIPSWSTFDQGATHFVEVAFAMRNLEGVGYPPIRTPPFQGLAESYTELAELMSSDWIKFVATGDPNGWKGRERSMGSLGMKRVPDWPGYTLGKKGQGPVNFLYEGNVTSSTERDTVRKEAIGLINAASLDVYGR